MTRLWLAVLILGTVSATAGTIQYSLPPHSMVSDVAFSGDGRLVVASTRQLLVIDPSGRARTLADDLAWFRLVATTDGAVWGHADGRLLVRVDPATDRIARFQLPDFIESFGAGDDGALWLIARRNDARSLLRLDADGQFVSSAPLAAFERLGPRLVAAGGAMWGVRGSSLIRLGAAGATGSFPLPLPNAYWFASGGDFLWLANDPLSGEGSSIVRVGPAGEVLARYPPPVTYIIGAAADRLGNLWLIDEYDGELVRMTPSGEVASMTRLIWDGFPLDVQPLAAARDGRIAVAMSDPGFFPAWPMRGVVFIVDPAQPHEIPALSPAALLFFALSIAVAGAGAARLTH